MHTLAHWLRMNWCEVELEHDTEGNLWAAFICTECGNIERTMQVTHNET